MTLLMPIYLLSFSLASRFVVDFVAGWILRPRLAITRATPKSAACHETIRGDYTVRNVGRLPAWNVYVDAILLPRFVADAAAALPYVGHLAPGEEVELRREIIPEKRGSYLLSMSVADSAFPFGLWRWGSSGLPNQPVLVYPG